MRSLFSCANPKLGAQGALTGPLAAPLCTHYTEYSVLGTLYYTIDIDMCSTGSFFSVAFYMPNKERVTNSVTTYHVSMYACNARMLDRP